MTKMQRIGLLTFHGTVNYGAFLQTYALQSVLSEMGFSVQVLNYINEALRERELPSRFVYTPKGAVKYLLRSGFETKRRDAFDAAMEKHLQITGKKTSGDFFEMSDYDFIVVGSDQVWNPRVNGYDEVYFGNNIDDKVRLISYAASMGEATAEDLISFCPNIKKLLQRFFALSVREEHAIAVLHDLDIGAQLVLDPTLLLKAEEWRAIIGESGNDADEPYLLLYTLNNEPELISSARDIARMLNLKIKCIHSASRRYFGMKNLKSEGPLDFVRLIDGASCVLTDSFHGTCFAINYEKQFFTKLSKNSVQSNIRMKNLLDRFGLTDRILSAEAHSDTIDYNKVRWRLADYRDQSFLYLKKALMVD